MRASADFWRGVGWACLVIAIVLFVFPLISLTLYSPDMQVYQEAKQSALARESTFSLRHYFWIAAVPALILGIIILTGVKLSEYWEKTSHRKRYDK